MYFSLQHLPMDFESKSLLMEINEHFRSKIKEDLGQRPPTLFVYLSELQLGCKPGLSSHTFLSSFNRTLCLAHFLDKSSIYRLLRNQYRDCQRVKSRDFPHTQRMVGLFGVFFEMKSRIPSESLTSRRTIVLPNAEHS